MLIERDILTDIFKWIHREETIILVGPRQSGKTMLLKIIEKKLKKEEHIVMFLNLEDEEILAFLNKSPRNLLKLINSINNKKVYVLLDEIQYLNNPTNFLKYIYDDHREQIKLIVSGSSAFYIDKKFKDSLAGRKKIFNVLPLNFKDYLSFKGREEFSYINSSLIDLNKTNAEINPIQKREYNRLLEEYILFGGYPKVVLEKDYLFKEELLGELLNSYVKKDVIEAKIRSREKFFALLKMLASHPGSLVNETELANTLAISANAINNYLYVMQKSFHIKLIRPFFNNVRKELSRMPKVFLYDNGLRNRIINNFEPIEIRPDKGDLFENFIFKMLIDQYGIDNVQFWRTQSKNEVDFILENEKKAIEVKYNSSLFKPKKYSTFLSNYTDFSFYLVYHKDKGKTPSFETEINLHKI